MHKSQNNFEKPVNRKKSCYEVEITVVITNCYGLAKNYYVIC